MTDEITITQDGTMATAGQIANQIASKHIFSDYRKRRAENTIKRQDNDLALFADYLQSLQLPIGNFAEDPQAWSGISWGLVDGFRGWLLKAGYAVSTVNLRLSTIKVYATMAAKAGAIDGQDLALIEAVKGYKRDEAKHIDENRKAEGIPTRRDRRRTGVAAGRKEQPVTLTQEQAAALKAQPDTPQGRRDRLLICLMIDHGLRAGEVAALEVEDIDLEAGEMQFYRPKVGKVQTHRLSRDTLRAASDYIHFDLSRKHGPLLMGSVKGGELTGVMSTRAVTQRVTDLGAALEIQGLSAHDLRHHWATKAARAGTPIDRLMHAGGWTSPAMPLRYIEAAKIANEGVILG